MSKAILGIDAGFCHTGWALGIPRAPDEYEWVACGCIDTKRSDKKLGIRVGDDNWSRSRELYRALWAIALSPDPVVAGLGVELPHGGSLSASAAGAMRAASAIVACLAESMRLPSECITPQQNKQSLCNTARASKAQMIEAAGKLYPYVYSGSKTHIEAQADAVGALWAVRHGDLFRKVLQLNEGQHADTA